MKNIAKAAGVFFTAAVLAACSGGNGGGPGSSGQGTGASPDKFVDGGTFTTSMSADPGNLDPQLSASSILNQLSAFAYDSLVATAKDGSIVSQLAKTWKVDGKSVTMTLNDGITCSDGSPFTADDAAANINFMSNPANKSAFVGLYVPAGAKASAKGSDLTIQLAAPSPFVLQGLSSAPMVCKAGLADRTKLEKQTLGTGPFQLSEVVPSDHITYTKRPGYTWGPGGATTAEKGMPATVTVKVVASTTTAANLLLSGGLNAATITGQDAARMAGAKLFAAQEDAVAGENWFNQAAGRPNSDPAVRKALTQALNFDQLRDVFTAKQGTAPTTFAVIPPAPCPGKSVAGNLPTGGVDAAKATLDAAGWTAGSDGTRSKGGQPLTLTFVYNTTYGPEGAAAGELASAAWKQLGAKVAMTGQDSTAQLNTLFTTGNWDIAWLTLNVSTPDQLVPFLSGPSPQNNFSHIKNADYEAKIAEAAKLPGKDGCETWLAAETNLVKAADVFPFANLPVRTFGKNAQFASGSQAVVPTTIRMLAN